MISIFHHSSSPQIFITLPGIHHTPCLWSPSPPSITDSPSFITNRVIRNIPQHSSLSPTFITLPTIHYEPNHSPHSPLFIILFTIYQQFNHSSHLPPLIAIPTKECTKVSKNSTSPRLPWNGNQPLGHSGFGSQPIARCWCIFEYLNKNIDGKRIYVLKNLLDPIMDVRMLKTLRFHKIEIRPWDTAC